MKILGILMLLAGLALLAFVVWVLTVMFPWLLFVYAIVGGILLVRIGAWVVEES